MSNIQTDTALEADLIQTESNRSLFETQIRQRQFKTLPLALFELGNTLSPPLTTITRSFPKTIAHHHHRLLTPHKPSLSTSPSTARRIAVLFSGGPAAGGHNVLHGLLQTVPEPHTLLGVYGGPKGLLNGRLSPITSKTLAPFINGGGFDCLGTDRTKIKTTDQMNAVKAVVSKHRLDGLIIIGGDDSNTNAAVLAEVLYDHHCTVVGVPKTIDGDLQVGATMPISFGFDTATKLYAELVGNLLQDSRSSLKYWHFVKLMGRSASHVALEVALQTKPALTFISEEVASKKQTLKDITDAIVKIITQRAHAGIHHGVIVIPEGLIEHIPECKTLIQELSTQTSDNLTPASAAVYHALPVSIQRQLTRERDAHGNVQVSLIQTEQLLIDTVSKQLANTSIPFQHHHHFFGYEGRCGSPTLFDAWYCLNLGRVAGQLALAKHTGYMAAITDLNQGGKAVGIPLTALLTTEIREGKAAFVIEKATVALDSPAFQYFAKHRDRWAKTDCFSSPGPRQFWGPTAHQLPLSVALNQGYETYRMPNVSHDA